jgi:ascorbate-specific PTS system EIIC-type component UlaA
MSNIKIEKEIEKMPKVKKILDNNIVILTFYFLITFIPGILFVFF